MKIDVYDSYAQLPNGSVMHFDVFVESDTPTPQALQYGRDWLLSIGEEEAALDQSRCNFCHSEMANPAVAETIKSDGFFLLRMEGCPAAS